jgi:hypothetical protein
VTSSHRILLIRMAKSNFATAPREPGSRTENERLAIGRAQGNALEPDKHQNFPDTTRTYLWAAILFVLNGYVCWRAFRLEWNSRMDSIEGAYIGISRHILANWGDLSWWPAWYGGIPFRNSYPPLLHYLVALWAGVLHVSAARAHHAVTALLYAAGPVFAYLLIRKLSRRPFASFCAALLYTVVSPCGLLVKKIGADMVDPLTPRRLGTLIAYGDGPHLAGLALMPLAVYLFHLALEKRRPLNYGMAVAGLVAVACTNWLSALALSVMILCYLAAFGCKRDWALAAGLGLAAYVVAMPLIPPSLIRTVQLNARTVGADYSNSLSLFAKVAPFALAALVGMKWLMARFRTPEYLQMLVLFAAVMAGFTLGDLWGGVPVVPQANRYQLEMDLGLALGAGMAISFALEKAPAAWRGAGFALVCLLAAEQTVRAHRYAKDLIRPLKIESTLEYRTARWFDEHLAGERVMVPGSCEFWLSAFSESPQLGGGFAQGITNPVQPTAEYLILNGAGTQADAQLAMLWLKAFGVQAIEAGGEKTREYYHAFRIGGSFRGVLKELWREGDDAIYKLPQRNASLAHVMAAEQLVSARPYNGLDTGQLQRYVAALDDGALPEATFRWKAQHSAEIETSAQSGQRVSIQISYDRGWRATANGRPAQVQTDGLGMMAIDPKCNGACRIELNYADDAEMTVSRWLSGMAILSWGIWLIVPLFQLARSRRDS